MYAMRYGAPPVTHAVGGIVDTVEDAGEVEGDHHAGSGFTFGATTADDLGRCLMRAESWYNDRESWNQLQRRAMVRDYGWERSARRYLDLYAALVPGARQNEQAAAAMPVIIA
jgi:starch synthase